jgi:(R,R)-butanediol dehydrogenase/meso-butanediol dehydrogenase/diacetyl reductase
MKSWIVTGPGAVDLQNVEEPTVGAGDVLVAVKACGICGTDVHYLTHGGAAGREGATPLGHEIAGEVVQAGDLVEGVKVGDHVVINPMAAPDGVIGNGGAQGGLSELLLVRDARPGTSLRVVPAHIPWVVAALNEPMAVAYHGVNRSGAGQGTKAVVFGAGPVGLGAAIGLKSKGAAHVVVVDVVSNRLEKALRVGADAVINSAEEDVLARLKELHGEEPSFMGYPTRALTDVAIDAAGVPVVVNAALAALRHGGVLTIIAVHKRPVELSFSDILSGEPDIRWSMGYPTEIFEVTDSIVSSWENYQQIISDIVPFAETPRAVELAGNPGASDKVIVTLE